MVSSKAKTVAQYLAELPEERRDALAAVRATILKHLPKGYDETMASGMIAYTIPLERYPKTYNGAALIYAALASQKNYMSVYMMGLYADPAALKSFEDEYKKAGKKLDMGKSCVRFKTLDELPLKLIGKTVAAMNVEAYIGYQEAARGKRSSSTARDNSEHRRD